VRTCFSRIALFLPLIGLAAGCGTSNESPAPRAVPSTAAQPAAIQTVSESRPQIQAPVPKQQSKSTAATPAEAVSRLVTAAKSGDISRLAAFLAPPMDSLMLEREQLRADVLVAHEKVLHELDAAFGTRTDQGKRPFGSELAEQLLAGLSANGLVAAASHMGDPKVVDQREEPGRMLLTVEQTPAGQKEARRTQWAAIKVGTGWKVAPAGFDPTQFKAGLERSRTLLKSYRAAAQEVREGQYKSRQQVDSVMLWALAATQPALFRSDPPPELKDILALPPDSASKNDSIRIEMHVSASPSNQMGRVALHSMSSGTPIWEGPIDKLAGELSKLRKDLAGQPQPYWIVSPEAESTRATLEALKSLLDSGFDYRRVIFDRDMPRFRALEHQFTGRLRLFAIRSAATQKVSSKNDALTSSPASPEDLRDFGPVGVTNQAHEESLSFPGMTEQSQELAIPWRPPGAAKLPTRSGSARPIKLREVLSFSAFPADGDTFPSLSVSPDGKYITAPVWQDEVDIWESSTGRLSRSFKVEGNPCGVQFSPDGKSLAIAIQGLAIGPPRHAARVFSTPTRIETEKSSIQLWRIADKKLVYTLKGHNPTQIAFRPDGKRLASSDFEGQMRIWDAENGRLLSTLKFLAVENFVYRPDGRRVASQSFGGRGKISIWDPDSGDQMVTWEPDEPVEKLTYSPNGRRLVGVSEYNVYIWDLANDKVVHTTKLEFQMRMSDKHRAAGLSPCCAFSPDGRWLAVATCHEITIWNARTGKLAYTNCKMNPPGKSPIAWSPNGRWLASPSSDRKIEIWHLE
jgi:WD40 repeat protein